MSKWPSMQLFSEICIRTTWNKQYINNRGWWSKWNCTGNIQNCILTNCMNVNLIIQLVDSVSTIYYNLLIWSKSVHAIKSTYSFAETHVFVCINNNLRSSEAPVRARSCNHQNLNAKRPSYYLLPFCIIVATPNSLSIGHPLSAGYQVEWDVITKVFQHGSQRHDNVVAQTVSKWLRSFSTFLVVFLGFPRDPKKPDTYPIHTVDLMLVLRVIEIRRMLQYLHIEFPCTGVNKISLSDKYWRRGSPLSAFFKALRFCWPRVHSTCRRDK